MSNKCYIWRCVESTFYSVTYLGTVDDMDALLSEAFLHPDPPVRVACGADRGCGAKKSISVALRIHWLRLSAIT